MSFGPFTFSFLNYKHFSRWKEESRRFSPIQRAWCWETLSSRHWMILGSEQPANYIKFWKWTHKRKKRVGFLDNSHSQWNFTCSKWKSRHYLPRNKEVAFLSAEKKNCFKDFALTNVFYEPFNVKNVSHLLPDICNIYWPIEKFKAFQPFLW